MTPTPEQTAPPRVRPNTRTLTDAAVLDALRHAQALLGERPLSLGALQRLCVAHPDDPRLVAPRTAAKRFGGWSNALERAGLATNRRGNPNRDADRPDYGRARTFSDADCLAALARVAEELGSPRLSVAAYDAYRAEREPSLPASGTITSRATWTEMCARAGLRARRAARTTGR